MSYQLEDYILEIWNNSGRAEQRALILRINQLLEKLKEEIGE